MGNEMWQTDGQGKGVVYHRRGGGVHKYGSSMLKDGNVMVNIEFSNLKNKSMARTMVTTL